MNESVESGSRPVESKRICVIGLNQGHGGAQTAYRELVRFLVEDGHAVGAISIGDGDRHCLDGVRFELTVPFAKNGFRRVLKGISAWRAARRCRRFQPAIFVSVGLGGVPNYIAKRLPRTTVKISQEFIFTRDPSDRARAEAAAAFDAIAPQAPSMEKSLTSSGLPVPVRWLPCFPTPPVTGVLATAGGGTTFRAAYFGRIERNKGLDLLVAAVRQNPRLQRVQLDIWGSGRLEELRRDIDSAGLSATMRICGPYPSGPEGAHLMASYNALVLPTTSNEGLPLILLEAMAYGLPLLTTRVGAIPDCCEANPDAVMIEPTVEGIQAGFEELLGRAESGELSPSRQRALYTKKFSRSAMAARWRECLRNPVVFFSGGAA